MLLSLKSEQTVKKSIEEEMLLRKKNYNIKKVSSISDRPLPQHVTARKTSK
ncbi:hypothetical protein DPMN_000696 [Dreissena polymorpha]|uniref:Uncharacterized protein n=1 Tax=Dreissena polymorpha TaxID=45954 RepID=A0A9D4MGC2_DREPO|nr:hypothetical protein DPMN_000696 [Dreissena polymorpha]